ncbi:protein fwdD [Candidatus Bathyarchaeota archaeon]|nr:MAG: protein fwdD [Candidatus Bathyarchaeota archaeon]
MEAVLLTGRTLSQGMGVELGKSSSVYYRSVVTCEMNAEDMRRLGVAPGDPVRIITEHGSVVVRVVEALEEVPQGVIFIPYGPMINAIIGPETHGTGMPSFKGISVKLKVGGTAIPRGPGTQPRGNEEE